MSAATLRILQAASEIAGGNGPLADRLGISRAMLQKYMSGVFPLPDGLLLRAVDMVLAERDSLLGLPVPTDSCQPSEDRAGG